MYPYTTYRSGPVTSVTKTSSNTTSTSAGYRQLSCASPPYLRGDFVRPNEWSFGVVDSSLSNGTQQFYVDGKWQTSSFGFLGTEAIAFIDVSTYKSRAYDQALSRLNEKLRGSLDLSVAAVEAKQTARMVNLVSRYTQAMSRMKRVYISDVFRVLDNPSASRSQKYRAAVRYSKFVKSLDKSGKSYRRVPVNRGLISRASALGANGWLEWTYGWSPLINDIKSVADNMVGRLAGASSFFHAKGQIGVDVRRVSKATSSSPKTTESASGFVGCQLKVKMTGDFDPGLSQWSSLNPASVIWEATPYSFVLDWFFDLGSYMRNLETSVIFSNRFHYGYVSYLSVVSYTYKVSGKTTGSLNYFVENSQAVKKVVSFSRSLVISYPSPNVPKLDINLGSSRLLSAASLLRQLIK